MKIVGKTSDGQLVVGDLYYWYQTEGTSFDMVLGVCKEKNYLPDWWNLFLDATRNGMKKDNFLSQLEDAIVDVYGRQRSDQIMETLNKMIEYCENKYKEKNV